MMPYLSQAIFMLLLGVAIFWFAKNIRRVMRNIRIGREEEINDRKKERWMETLRVALGQSKMVSRPVAGIMHIFIYVGFVIINIEVLEIILDGITGKHRLFSFIGMPYYYFITAFEVLAFLVLVSCVVFLARRHLVRVKRFVQKDLDGFPGKDADIILVTEILLMSAFLFMNAADGVLMSIDNLNIPMMMSHYGHTGIHIFGLDAKPGSTLYFPVSAWLTGFLPDSWDALVMIERVCWWFHIVGILLFLNYLPYSKHFHIILAFPNVWYSKLGAKGQFTNLESVTKEVKLMLDPSLPVPTDASPSRFGAKDVNDLSWVQLLNAYSCTECGRCSSACPANQTGKLLSPRKIMMQTRDRMEEAGKLLDKGENPFESGKTLLHDYITPEELWACTTCNACVQECPININPLSIIMDLRRYLVMEESAAPASLNTMFTNVENNGAPWQFAASDRLNWKNEE
ncbi:MAG: 4Fe-4S dicluster domain-containing protein [Bacteroidota bacterium]|jgi:heterodisulfide reductase subunit C